MPIHRCCLELGHKKKEENQIMNTKWRVIVRMGLTRDERSILRNTFAPLFVGCGFERTQTGTWENTVASPVCATKTLSKVLRKLAELPKVKGVAGEMKHFWVYLDKVTKST
jgi:hypothetical protein